MMKLNSFESADAMPEPIPIDANHPFVLPDDDPNSTSAGERQYVAQLPERKEWQTQVPTQDATDIFKPGSKLEPGTDNKRA